MKSRLLICDFSDMTFAAIDVYKEENCPACQEATALLPEVKEKLVWICGRKTANINPENLQAKPKPNL